LSSGFDNTFTFAFVFCVIAFVGTGQDGLFVEDLVDQFLLVELLALEIFNCSAISSSSGTSSVVQVQNVIHKNLECLTLD